MLRYLAEDDIDAFTLQPDLPEDLDVHAMGEEELVAVFPTWLRARAQVRGRGGLARLPVVTPRTDSAIARAVADFFERAGEPLQVSLESGDPFLLRCLVSTGFGASAPAARFAESSATGLVGVALQPGRG